MKFNWALIVLSLSLLCKPLLAAPLEIVTTIPPLAAIASEVCGADCHITSLSNRQQSPHQMALKPSHLRLLANAELVIWLGPDLEPALAGAIGKSSRPALAFAALPGLLLLQEDGGEDELDPHLWLSPDNALTLARAISHQLATLHPELENSLNQRLTSFEQAMSQFKSAVAVRLPHQAVLYNHNAFRYFEAAFALPEGLALQPSEHSPPSLQHLQTIEQAIGKMGIRCMIITPQFHSPLADKIAIRHQLKLLEADPLGVEGEISKPYQAMLEAIGSALGECGSKQ